MVTQFAAAGATGMMTPQMLAAISRATELSLGVGGVSGGGGSQDEMDVPQSSIGKLIGKGGATIQSIRDQSKAGVQVRKIERTRLFFPYCSISQITLLILVLHTNLTLITGGQRCR